jgi:gliding motility-associated protein GldC
MEVKSQSEIKINVGLDEEKIPVQLSWEAPGSPGNEEAQECKAVLLSIFDKKTLDTLKIDLWTKEMQVVEMDRFIFQTLRAITDTYYKATQNQKLANAMQQFVTFFGEETEVIPKNK